MKLLHHARLFLLQRDRKLPAAAQGKFNHIAWRAEDSFSLPQQKKDAFPASPTSPSSPHPLTHSPVVHVPLSPNSGSRSSSSGEYGRRGSGESKYYDEESGYVGPEDLGYNTRSSSLPYNQSPPSSKKHSVPEDSKEQLYEEDEEPLPSPRSARKARRRSMKQQRRDPPPPPSSLPLSPTSPSASSDGVRRYAPARPSPLAQAVYRNSALSPSPSPIPPPSTSAPEPAPEPAPVPTYIPSVDVQSPPNSPFADPADPFLDNQQSQHYHHNHHDSRHYPEENEADRPVSGVGYAI